ncbi:MAG: GNAT family N-acetyltransferase [Paracoccus sp. (in: a-proteobacteria)]|uniref:GNAT family N-acetyltransferase n=1 Tax=Paracoccus sp. TaxID=267 RepID=UPI0026DF3690|nr:GNAT family N-acetyltransferase [Paracoccus sp. (in: a-proteobacteria)]MDO5631322.1 GNAT family N-acetyltransferase [Paracoccus sp. (in: a-proteobacteria)]
MIRPARPDDAPGVGAIWNPIIRDTTISFWPVERHDTEIAALIAQRQADGHGFFVAETEGTITGFASYGQFRAGLGYAHSLEHSIHIAPQARGLGVGRALMEIMLDHAREGGGRIMVAGITGWNTGSVAFHTRFGFVHWGMIPNAGWKFGTWHDLILMGLDLATPPA